ncbi:hypothetical protein, partial [Absicoccus porci]|uniref:hypothetical protein n=1 Tax=Absicoccus porci TaxID=2486576 RepID=UPI003D91CB7C
ISLFSFVTFKNDKFKILKIGKRFQLIYNETVIQERIPETKNLNTDREKKIYEIKNSIIRTLP